MYNGAEQRVILEIHRSIENELNRLGLLFRVFSRAKSAESIELKINNNLGKYLEEGKKIQDLFGVRVALYFPDDLPIAQKAIGSMYKLDSKMVDDAEKDSFAATRCNFIFKLNEELSSQSATLKTNKLIDNTFEVQFRTVLSEGWHEVEHDLRYKCQADWKNHDDLSRALNGIFATLETSDWGMMKLFEDLAYRHYKASEWAAMLRTKFRLRSVSNLDENIVNKINSAGVGKDIYRLNRDDILLLVLNYKIDIPLTMNNLVYLCNFFFIKSKEIDIITPSLLKSTFREHKERYSNT